MVTTSFLLKAADAKIEHYKWLDLLVLPPQSLWQCCQKSVKNLPVFARKERLLCQASISFLWFLNYMLSLVRWKNQC